MIEFEASQSSSSKLGLSSSRLGGGSSFSRQKLVGSGMNNAPGKNFDWSQAGQQSKKKSSWKKLSKTNLAALDPRMNKSMSFCTGPSAPVAAAMLKTRSSSSNDIIKDMMNDFRMRRRNSKNKQLSQTTTSLTTTDSPCTSMKERLQQMKILSVPQKNADNDTQTAQIKREHDRMVMIKQVKLKAQMHITMAKMFTGMDGIPSALEEYNKAVMVWLAAYQRLVSDDMSDNDDADEALLSAVSIYGIMADLYIKIGDEVQALIIEDKCNHLLTCSIENEPIQIEEEDAGVNLTVFSIENNYHKDSCGENALAYYQSMATECERMGKYTEAKNYLAKADEYGCFQARQDNKYSSIQQNFAAAKSVNETLNHKQSTSRAA